MVSLTMAARILLAIFLGPLLATMACHSQGQQEATQDGKQPEFADIKVTDDSTNLLFTYLVADGSFVTVNKAADVPEAARDQVVVIDTNLSPEQRQSSRIIYVADLTRQRPDGSYPCRPVSRFKFERDLLREPAQGAPLPPECRNLAPSPTDRVIVYGTSWCSVCDATKAFLKQQGIPFLEKDVEKDAAAQKELTCKALKSGTKINGVPVLDIGGKLLLGFDRNEIMRLTAGMRKKS